MGSLNSKKSAAQPKPYLDCKADPQRIINVILHYWITQNMLSPMKFPTEIVDVMVQFVYNQSIPATNNDDEKEINTLNWKQKYGDQYQVILNIKMIGDSGVGKSLLQYVFASHCHEPSYQSIMGFRTREIHIDALDDYVKLTIFDSNDCRFVRDILSKRNMVTYKDIDGICLIYDVTDRDSISNIIKWKQHIDANASENVEVILVGNKIDLNGEEVTGIDIHEIAKLCNIELVVESSAMLHNNGNVDTMFRTLAERIVQKRIDLYQKRLKYPFY